MKGFLCINSFNEPYDFDSIMHYGLDTFAQRGKTETIRILPGLGNHDYENNVNDCVSNHCANRMLFW